MILQHCNNHPISLSFFVPHLKKNCDTNWQCSIKKSVKILGKDLRKCYSLKSLFRKFKLNAETTGSRTMPEYDNLVWPSPGDAIPFWKRDFPSWDISSNDHVVISKDSGLVHVVHITAEMAPIAKVGGLGDVVTGLARACLMRGHKVEVFIPFYEFIDKLQIKDLAFVRTYNSFHDENWIAVSVYQGVVLGIPVKLIEPSNHFFKGQYLYGGSYDELEAYLFFSRACLEWMQVTESQPDIIHVHEWQASCLPLLYWDMYHYLSLKKPRIVLTIHNMEHYGECSTVSPTYLKETLCSGWLAGTLIRHRDKYFGILNGIDTAIWNPATDVFLPAKFDANKIEGKKICKLFVQKGLGLASEGHQWNPDKAPLVVCITRLVAQKGLHLITSAIKYVKELDGQMVVLGKAPDVRVEREFEGLAKLYNQGSSIRILLTYSEELSHMLYAAADVLLVPSIYEPCGLTQMIGMRYGAVPVVRKTGGLADTVFDVDEDHTQPEMANGFTFEGIDEVSLNRALDHAFLYYRQKPNEWIGIVKRVMKIDNSWNNTAGKYIDVYNTVRVRDY